MFANCETSGLGSRAHNFSSEFPTLQIAFDLSHYNLRNYIIQGSVF